jgi:iron complex outermembrane receptor protein
LAGSFRKRRVCSTKLRQRHVKQRSTSSRREPAKSPCGVGAFQTRPARGEFGSVETNPTRGANDRRTEQATSTQHTKRAAGTRSPRSNQWLRCRAFLDRHQDQYAIDGNAAGDSIIGREQIRGQNPNSFAEALRYAPGVRSETFGADTRNDWFKIRGFDAQDAGLFLDGLQLSSFAFATWKFQPFGIERIDILRGPSAVLYGGSGPGGLVNVISKKPPFEPLNYLEAGVNSYGNRYLSFDFGGPVATPSGPSNELYYRLLGTVKGGETQTAFTPDDNYFIAPSVTYKPDVDTTLTILASASKNQTRVQGFLPYDGTVVNAPFGRIPTRLFASDPSVDSFTREQEMIGYQFEKHLTDDLTFRQNGRFAHDDVKFQTLLGNGYVDNNPATAQLSRFNDFAHDIANQGNLDSQFEYRFATGPVLHKALVGVDLKSYEISDLQAFDFATPPLNLVNPVYGVAQGFPANVFADQTITQKQVGVYAQDQLKLGRLTLVLSGRNDWVNTLDNNRLAPQPEP